MGAPEALRRVPQVRARSARVAAHELDARAARRRLHAGDHVRGRDDERAPAADGVDRRAPGRRGHGRSRPRNRRARPRQGPKPLPRARRAVEPGRPRGCTRSARGERSQGARRPRRRVRRAQPRRRRHPHATVRARRSVEGAPARGARGSAPRRAGGARRASLGARLSELPDREPRGVRAGRDRRARHVRALRHRVRAGSRSGRRGDVSPPRRRAKGPDAVFLHGRARAHAARAHAADRPLRRGGHVRCSGGARALPCLRARRRPSVARGG